MIVPIFLSVATTQTVQLPAAQVKALAWTAETWTADESPYLGVRKEVEGLTDGRKVSDKKTDLCERTELATTAARANPKDPVILYRAAYLRYMLGGLDYSPEAKAVLARPAVAMGSVPSPRSREYNRLRMLREGFLNERFVDLGERLYRYDPNDRELALKLVWTHAYFRPASHKRAVEIAERLMRTEDPKRYPALYYADAIARFYYHTDDEIPTLKEYERVAESCRKYLAAGPEYRARFSEAQALSKRVDEKIAKLKSSKD